LDKLGFKYFESEGYFLGDRERSFFVIHKSPSEFAVTNQLGMKYRQQQVMHGNEGQYSAVYTKGPNSGTHEQRGGVLDWEASTQPAGHTTVELPNGTTARFSVLGLYEGDDLPLTQEETEEMRRIEEITAARLGKGVEIRTDLLMKMLKDGVMVDKEGKVVGKLDEVRHLKTGQVVGHADSFGYVRNQKGELLGKLENNKLTKVTSFGQVRGNELIDPERKDKKTRKPKVIGIIGEDGIVRTKNGYQLAVMKGGRAYRDAPYAAYYKAKRNVMEAAVYLEAMTRSVLGDPPKVPTQKKNEDNEAFNRRVQEYNALRGARATFDGLASVVAYMTEKGGRCLLVQRFDPKDAREGRHNLSGIEAWQGRTSATARHVRLPARRVLTGEQGRDQLPLRRGPVASCGLGVQPRHRRR
jgi:hypothetical protein